jgi:hypothetical protein
MKWQYARQKKMTESEELHPVQHCQTHKPTTTNTILTNPQAQGNNVFLLQGLSQVYYSNLNALLQDLSNLIFHFFAIFVFEFLCNFLSLFHV